MNNVIADVCTHCGSSRVLTSEIQDGKVAFERYIHLYCMGAAPALCRGDSGYKVCYAKEAMSVCWCGVAA